MPCPPSYEELRFLNLDIASEAVKASIQHQLPEVPDTIRLLEIVANVPGVEALLQDIEGLMARLQRRSEEAKGIALDFDFPKGWPEMEDVVRYEAFVTALERYNSDVELTLCQTRTMLYANRETFSSSAAFQTPEVAQLWEQEISRHALHRESDRQAQLKMVERDRLHYENRLKENLSPTQRESAQAYFELYSQKVAAIKAIPITTLLADRSLF